MPRPRYAAFFSQKPLHKPDHNLRLRQKKACWNCEVHVLRQARNSSPFHPEALPHCSQKSGLHTGGTNASDLFLIYKETASGTFRCLFHLQHCRKRSIGAYTVILSICRDHAAVKSTVSGFSCRNDLQLCGKKIFLFNTIFFIQDIQNVLFYSIFFLSSGRSARGLLPIRISSFTSITSAAFSGAVFRKGGSEDL